jgi:hypothetical protein
MLLKNNATKWNIYLQDHNISQINRKSISAKNKLALVCIAVISKAQYPPIFALN